MHNNTGQMPEDDEQPVPGAQDHEAPEEATSAEAAQSFVSPAPGVEISHVFLDEATMRALSQWQFGMAKTLAPYLAFQEKLARDFYGSWALADAVRSQAAVAERAAILAQEPGWVTALGKLADAYGPLTDLSRDLQQWSVASRLTETLAALRSQAARLSGTSAGSWRSYCPPNWDARTWSHTDVDTAVAILHSEGIPLAWVPRAAIVAELMTAADESARAAILASRTTDIVADCRAALAEVTDPDLKHLVDLNAEALDFLAEFPSGAQALAANLFDTLVREAIRRGRMFGGSLPTFDYKRFKQQITPATGTTLINEFRVACVLTPMLRALERFDPANSPTPTEYNRHSTAHRAHPQHYTPANAVIAVMLSISALREAQESGW